MFESQEKNDPNDSYMGHIYAIVLQSIIKIIFLWKEMHKLPN